MDEKYRICPFCGKKKEIENYPPVSNLSQYGKNGLSIMCIDCICDRVNKNDLETVDRMCQFLDLPFDADKWVAMARTHEELSHRIMEYCVALTRDQYQDSDWSQVNNYWKKAREYGGLVDKIPAIHSDLLLYLRKKWGNSSELTLEDYIRMEEYERHTLSHYPFKDEARKDVIRKLAKLSVLSDKYISEGNTKDATAYLQSYNTLMKELGIGNEIAANESSINSLSELVSYLEKKGFVLNYRINEDRDIVDKTLKNMEQYVRRLFNDSQETVNEMYNQKEISNESGTVIDDDDLEALYASDGEEKVELEEVLNEEELEQMFQQVENEFR